MQINVPKMAQTTHHSKTLRQTKKNLFTYMQKNETSFAYTYNSSMPSKVYKLNFKGSFGSAAKPFQRLKYAFSRKISKPSVVSKY